MPGRRSVSRKRSTRAEAPGYFDGLRIPRSRPSARTANVQLVDPGKAEAFS
jgi:hypothetical protein